MKSYFTVTSPTNALAVSIYCMFAFFGVLFLLGGGNVGVTGQLGHGWSTMLLISSSAAVYATLSATRRRDPDQSLIIEFWSCILLCTLLVWLEVFLLGYRTESGGFATTSFGFGLIFAVGFGARAIQIRNDRKSLKQFRANEPPSNR